MPDKADWVDFLNLDWKTFAKQVATLYPEAFDLCVSATHDVMLKQSEEFKFGAESVVGKYLPDVEHKKKMIYNPELDTDDNICKCGHTYHRHFDPYENYRYAGCKYCWHECDGFVPNGPPTRIIKEGVSDGT